MKTSTAVLAFALVGMGLGLAACGGETKPAESAAADKPAAEVTPPAPAPAAAPAPAPAPDPKTVIEARQANLKDMGKAFKTISDQLKAPKPDMALISASGDTVKKHAADIGNWFPAGTGPESNIKTEALPKIWEDQAGFQAAVAKLQDEAGKLQTATASGDIKQVKDQFPKTGGACKNCHDTYRKPDEK